MSINARFHLATLAIAMLCVVLFRVVGYDIRRAPRFLANNWRWIAVYALLIVVATHALLLAPPPPEGSQCVETHRVWGPLQMVLSCDSHQFVTSARGPYILLTPQWWSQSRPLSIMPPALLTRLETPAYAKKLLDYPYGVRLQPGWLPYVVVSFALLLVALMCFRRLNAPATTTSAATVIVLSTFLVFSDVVKGFFWSAHTQMWNVLMPLIAISLSHAFLLQPVKRWTYMAATGLLLGLGFLAYGNLVLCVIAAPIAIGVGARSERTSLRAVTGRICLFLVSFAVPVMSWAAFVRRVAGSFYSAETEAFREFVWVLDSWRAGGFGAVLRQAKAFFLEFLVYLATVSWPALTLVVIVVLVGAASPEAVKEAIRTRSRLLVAAAITLALCFVFYALMGFYRNRLEFNVAMPVIVAASVVLTGLLERLPKREATRAFAMLVLAVLGVIGSALVRITWPY